MRKRLKFFALLSTINAAILLMIIYHEPILTALEFVKMPSSDYSCHQIPFNLTSSVASSATDRINFENLTQAQIEAELSDVGLKNGGRWSPAKVSTGRTFHVAIIVPYRDRRRNLNIFLLYMHRFLSSQGIDYGIYLVEPRKNLKFNRAMLLNIGFLEAIGDNAEWDCFIFHDVDMLPENIDNLYQCDPKFPKQLAISINKFFYNANAYLKDEYFGGVNAFTKNQFLTINGFSNSYFGWGIEDDDARLRVLDKFTKISRQLPDIGRYFANCHEVQERNPDRFLLYMTASSRMEADGLNSISYRIDRIEKNLLFTRFFVYYRDNLSR